MRIPLVVFAMVATLYVASFVLLTRPVVARATDHRAVSLSVRCGYRVARGNWISYPFAKLTAGTGLSGVPMHRTRRVQRLLEECIASGSGEVRRR